MRLSVSLLAFSSSLLVFGQQGNGPKLGSDAPTMGYKEVPDWPTRRGTRRARPAHGI